MTEASAKSVLIKRLAPLDAVAIESPRTGLGIPDVNISLGWIECKAMKAWPKNCDTRPVIFPHPLSKEQQVWLYRRERAGGLALVMGKVSNVWFFWSGRKIKERNLWDNMTRPQMYQEAEKVFTGKLNGPELIDFLKWRSQNLLSQNIF